MNKSEKMYRERIYKNYLNSQELLNRHEVEVKYHSREPYLKKIISKHFPKNKNSTILDLGCGGGELIYCAKKSGYKNISGVDCSDQQVASAKMLGVSSVVKGDLLVELSKLKQASLDCIISFDVLEHFSKNEIIEFVDQVQRALVSGGTWIIHVPNGDSIFFGKVLFGDFTHEIAFTKASAAQLFGASGFSSVEAYEDRPVIHGFKSAIRYLCWLVIRFFLRSYILVESGSDNGQIFSQNLLIVVTK